MFMNNWFLRDHFILFRALRALMWIWMMSSTQTRRQRDIANLIRILHRGIMIAAGSGAGAGGTTATAKPLNAARSPGKVRCVRGQPVLSGSTPTLKVDLTS